MNKIIAIILFFYPTILSAQHNISGKIIDADTKMGVAFANIMVVGTHQWTSTDENGTFNLDLKDLKMPQKVLVQSVSYQTDTFIIDSKTVFYEWILRGGATALKEVVVSGTMKESSKMDSPVPIEVYTPAFFQRNPSNNLFSALESINGVRPQISCNVCNAGDIHINGMEGSYTLILIDGMPIVSSLSTVYGLMGIPNSLVQRIEVVKGAAGTLYGSEAVGGLINIITKTPEKSPRFGFDIMTGTYKDINIDVQTKYKIKNAESLLSANVFNFNTKWDINNDNFTDITLQKRASIFNKWSFYHNNNKIVDIAARYVWENRWGGELQWQPRWRGTDSIYGENIITNRAELIGNYYFTKIKNLKLSYSFNTHNQKSAYGTSIYNAKQNIAFTQLIYNKKINSNNDLLLGTALRYTFYDDNTPITANENDININKPSKIILPGVFVQDELSINKHNRLLMGLRYDYHSEHGHIFTPRLNYQWKPTEINTLRLSFGNGYRVVNLFSEEHAALTGAREVAILSDLKPEKSYNFNANYMTRVYYRLGFMNIDASIFYTYFRNRIVADYMTDANKVIFDNLKGYGISRGATLNTDFYWYNGFKIVFGVTYNDVFTTNSRKFGTKNRIYQVQTPPLSANFTLTYTFPKTNITLDYTGNIYSPMLLPILENDFRPEKSPWFSIQNIQISKKWGEKTEVYLGVKNLLNFVPKDPIMRPFDPFDKNISVNNQMNYTFDPNYNYAAVQGIRGFLGLRYHFN